MLTGLAGTDAAIGIVHRPTHRDGDIGGEFHAAIATRARYHGMPDERLRRLVRDRLDDDRKGGGIGFPKLPVAVVKFALDSKLGGFGKKFHSSRFVQRNAAETSRIPQIPTQDDGAQRNCERPVPGTMPAMATF
jgi:hypothetical protein